MGAHPIRCTSCWLVVADLLTKYGSKWTHLQVGACCGGVWDLTAEISEDWGPHIQHLKRFAQSHDFDEVQRTFIPRKHHLKDLPSMKKHNPHHLTKYDILEATASEFKTIQENMREWNWAVIYENLTDENHNMLEYE